MLLSVLILSQAGCNRELYNLAFPPEDLYKPLIFEPFDVSIKNNSFEAEFRNKYPGFHVIGLVVPNPPLITENYNIEFILSVKVTKGDEVLLLELADHPVLPFWNGQQKESGIGLIMYQVPENLPEDTDLKIQVNVVKPSSEFITTYGQPSLFVQKFSDK